MSWETGCIYQHSFLCWPLILGKATSNFLGILFYHRGTLSRPTSLWSLWFHRGVMSTKPTLHRRVTLIWLSNMHWTWGALMSCWLISDWCKIAKYLFVLTVLPVTNARFSHACEASDHQLKCTLALFSIYLLISLIFLLIIWCLFLSVESGSCQI